MHIHHIGFLTKNLEKTRKEFLKLGYVVEQPSKYDEIRCINIEFINKDGYRVELIEPASKESPMYPLLKNYKNTPYHFCYEVDDLETSMEEMKEQRYCVIQEPESAPCIHNSRVVFMVHPSMGIVELVENK
jgi:methylmalonyl-CoA/ethylmalonyl-CoA epimerase